MRSSLSCPSSPQEPAERRPSIPKHRCSCCSCRYRSCCFHSCCNRYCSCYRSCCNHSNGDDDVHSHSCCNRYRSYFHSCCSSIHSCYRSCCNRYRSCFHSCCSSTRRTNHHSCRSYHDDGTNRRGCRSYHGCRSYRGFRTPWPAIADRPGRRPSPPTPASTEIHCASSKYLRTWNKKWNGLPCPKLARCNDQ